MNLRRRKLKRLVVENDGALFECVGAEESLEEQKRRAQQQRGQYRRADEEREL